jgi:hypothetical protein
MWGRPTSLSEKTNSKSTSQEKYGVENTKALNIYRAINGGSHYIWFNDPVRRLSKFQSDFRRGFRSVIGFTEFLQFLTMTVSLSYTLQR